ncbi:MAG: hypothetical protein ABI777_09590 [Betaproteobacteria bacterium]
MVTRNRRLDVAANIVLLIACIAAAMGASIVLRQDANWDLQNYHYYNPWAWVSGRIFTWDVAAAQLQTYHNALLDLPFYAMVAAAWPPEWIAAMLAVPTGIAGFFLIKLLFVLFDDLPKQERWIAIVCAFAMGMTSAIGIGVLGTTMNEWPLVALLLAALWLVARAVAKAPATALSRRTLLLAGLLCGLASGSKLTAATFAVGLCLAILLRGPYTRQAMVRTFVEAFVFGLGVLAGVAIALGPWAWALWTHFGSPIFPYGNQWIKSPWWGEYEVLSRQYGPHQFIDWVLFPFRLIAPEPFYVTEVPYRDGRVAMTYLLALLAAAAWWSHRLSSRPYPVVQAGVSAAWRLISIFFLTSFLLWTAQHSVYRYLLTLDLLTGALIVTFLWRLLRPGYAAGIAIVVAVVIIATTRPTDWWRIDFGNQWFEVEMPKVEPNALVLITTDQPVSYVLPSFPRDAKHLGVANNVNDPSRRTKMADLVNETIAQHQGPIYQLTAPAGGGSNNLLPHRLWRDQTSCAEITTKMLTSKLELCRLYRVRDYERP